MRMDGMVEGGNQVALGLFANLPTRYDRLGYLLSLGQDRRWRRTLVDRVGRTGPRRVLDVATGTAGVALALAERTGAVVVGADLSEPMLRVGVTNLAGIDPPPPIRLVRARAEQLPFPTASFDAITFSYLLRYVDDPGAVLSELARCLKPGGVLAGFDFHVPPNPLWRGAWWLYTRLLLPVAGGALGGAAWYRVGRFLGPSICAHHRRYPPSWHAKAWADAGLVDVRVAVMSLGGGLVRWGTRASDGSG